MEFSKARKLQSALVPLPIERAVSSLAVQSLLTGADKLGFIDKILGNEARDINVQNDISYGPHASHRLDILGPAEGKSRGSIVYVHGGGFRILSKKSHATMARLLARAGFSVFNIDYRLAPENPYPAAPADATRAIQFLSEQHSHFGFQPERFALMGESSGANIVTSMAVAMSFEASEPWARNAHQLQLTPRAVVPVCGFLQVSNPDRLNRSNQLSSFAKDKIAEASEAYLPEDHAGTRTTTLLADPLLFLEGPRHPVRELPPFFTAVGTADPLLEDTRRLEAALLSRGSTVEARYYGSEKHSFHAFFWRKAAHDFWKASIDFLGNLLSEGKACSRGSKQPSLLSDAAA